MSGLPMNLLAMALRSAQGGAAPSAGLRLPTKRAEDPDYLQALLQPVEAEEQSLLAQLRQTQAMGQAQSPRYSSPFAAGLGSLADVLRAGNAKQQAGVLNAQLRGNNQQRQEVIQAFGENPSASAVQRNEAMLGREQQAELRKLGSAGKPQLSTDPNSEASKAAQNLARATLSDQYTEEQIAGFSEAQLGNVLKYGSMAAQREVQRENTVAANERNKRQLGQSGYQFGQRMGLEREKLARQKEEDARKSNERNVGGWNFDPKDPPSTESAKKMADATIARDEIMQGLGRLEQLYSESGSEILGETAGEMEAEFINLTNRLRTLNEMGVPNGADYEMLAKQLEDPTTLKSILTSKDRGLAKIRTTRTQVERRVTATAKALKYRPKADGQPQRARPDQVLPQGPDGQPTLAPTARMRAPDGQVYEVDASEAGEAEKNGWKRL
jgi:hypothetical protein